MNLQICSWINQSINESKHVISHWTNQNVWQWADKLLKTSMQLSRMYLVYTWNNRLVNALVDSKAINESFGQGRIRSAVNEVIDKPMNSLMCQWANECIHEFNWRIINKPTDVSLTYSMGQSIEIIGNG